MTSRFTARSAFRILVMIGGSLAFLGWDCAGGDDPGPNPPPPQGPAGSILEFDAQVIPLGEHDAGHPSGDASREGSGGPGGTGPGGTGPSGAGGAGGARPTGTGGAGGTIGTGGTSSGVGGGAPQPHCTGAAFGCSLLASSQCLSAPGCTDDSYCGGVSASCYSQFDVYSCSSLEGCYWSSSSKTCSGSSWSCDLFNGSLSCVDQEGCSWRFRCGGVATPCSLLSTGQCTLQPGCHVENL
jgi:hypothetical protein